MVIASQIISIQEWASMADEERKKRTTGSHLSYKSENVDISIQGGVLDRLRDWIDRHWKLAAWRSIITILAAAGFFNGVSVRDMTVTSKERLTVLETKAVAYDESVTKIQTLERKVTGLEAISDEDKRELEKQAQQERSAKRRRELQEHLKARAEKLKKISQGEQLFADPALPTPETYPVFKGIKNE